jgi:hypothetical protein
VECDDREERFEKAVDDGKVSRGEQMSPRADEKCEPVRTPGGHQSHIVRYIYHTLTTYFSHLCVCLVLLHYLSAVPTLPPIDRIEKVNH